MFNSLCNKSDQNWNFRIAKSNWKVIETNLIRSHSVKKLTILKKENAYASSDRQKPIFILQVFQFTPCLWLQKTCFIYVTSKTFFFVWINYLQRSKYWEYLVAYKIEQTN